MKLPVTVKKKQRAMPIYAAVSIIMLCIALFCLFTPFIPPFSNALSKTALTLYMTLGGVCTMFFAFVTSYIIFNLISPPVGISIAKDGVYDYTVAGSGVGFIPKESIVSLKTFGNDQKQYLGIKIADGFVDELGASNAVRKEIQNNLLSGIPAVIIRESDISISVKKLLKLIIEAYDVEGVESIETVYKPPKELEDTLSDIFREDPPLTDIFKEDPLPPFQPKEEPTAEESLETVVAVDPVVAPVEVPDHIISSSTAEEVFKPLITPDTALEDSRKKEETETERVIKTVEELLAQLNIPTDKNGEQ